MSKITRKRILVVLGTRPEVIKLAPVIRELRSRSQIFDCCVVSTGQHREMVDQALAAFRLTVDIQLDAMASASTLGKLTSRLFFDIDALLDWLHTSKFLSEPRFAESLVNRRSARFGNSRIVSELQSHGMDPATVAALKINLVADEEARAWLVWEKKFGTAPAGGAESAKQMRFLQQRGFSHGAIQLVMRRAGRVREE